MLTALTVGVALVIAGPMLLIAALAGISIFFFARNRAKALGVPRGRAAMAYITAMVMANALFLGFGIFYLSLLGA
jgi:type III secretory pathway component EscV